jgi:Protein of unknown function (DUF1761)
MKRIASVFDFESIKQSLLNFIGMAPDYLPAINSTAVLAALITGWIVGSVWYGVAGHIWHDSIGKSGLGAFSPRRQIFAGIAQVIMTIMLANFMGRLSETTMAGGAHVALLLWFGFVMTTVLVNYANIGARLGLTIVDSIHWLLVLASMGAMIGLVNDLGLGVPAGAHKNRPVAIEQQAPATPAAVAPADGTVGTGSGGTTTGTTTGTGTTGTGG